MIFTTYIHSLVHKQSRNTVKQFGLIHLKLNAPYDKKYLKKHKII